MDDFVHSCDSLLEAQESTKALKVAFQKAGLNSNKFLSNTTEVLDFLNERKTENKSSTHRVLGLKLDTMNDTLINQPVLKNYSTAKEMYLRKIQSTVARIFDPL